MLTDPIHEHGMSSVIYIFEVFHKYFIVFSHTDLVHILLDLYLSVSFGDTILNIHWLISKIYKQVKQLNIKKNKQPNPKMGRRPT